VNIDTFQRLPPGTPASEDPTGPPQTTGEAGYQALITAGPIEAIASCFRKEGHKYVADGRVRLNGIDLTPASGNIVLDLDKLEVRRAAASRRRSARSPSTRAAWTSACGRSSRSRSRAGPR
jgi:hypothetical protein